MKVLRTSKALFNRLSYNIVVRDNIAEKVMWKGGFEKKYRCMTHTVLGEHSQQQTRQTKHEDVANEASLRLPFS